MKVKDLPRIDRPREKLQKYGSGKLSNSELLAILLGSGTKGLNVIELSKKILQRFPNGSLPNASFEELKQIKGLGDAKVCEIVASFELSKRLLQNKKAVLLLSPQAVW